MQIRKKMLLAFVLLATSAPLTDLSAQNQRLAAPNYGAQLGAIDHFIKLADAKKMIASYMDSRDAIQEGGFKNNDTTLPIAEAFNSAILKEILALDGCIGIRFFYGLKEKSNEMKLIAFGVNRKGELLFLKRKKPNTAPSGTASTRGGSDDYLLGGGEMTQKDPPFKMDRPKRKEYIMNQLNRAN